MISIWIRFKAKTAEFPRLNELTNIEQSREGNYHVGKVTFWYL